MAVQPITPNEVVETRLADIPDVVFEVVNEMLTREFRNGRAFIKQDDIVDAILLRYVVSRHEIFERGWLDIESHYRAAGWDVEYDKPAYYENYAACFKFFRKAG